MHEPSLTIFLACYNRPDYARLAIRSVTNQTDHRFVFRISDNSTNDLVQQMVAAEFPTVDYVRRMPSTIACTHGNIIIDECRTDHLMIMHDDDELTPNFVEEMLRFMTRFPDAGGYAANGPIIDETGNTIHDRFYRSGRKYHLISDPFWLARRWFAYATFSVAPFPSYIYKRSVVGGMRFDTLKRGQYGDFVFVHQCLIRSRSVAWLNLPLYRYRSHSRQDSARITFSSYSRMKIYMREAQPDYYGLRDFRIVRALHLIPVLGQRNRDRRRQELKKETIKAILTSPGTVARKFALLTLQAIDRLRVFARAKGSENV